MDCWAAVFLILPQQDYHSQVSLMSLHNTEGNTFFFLREEISSADLRTTYKSWESNQNQMKQIKWSNEIINFWRWVIINKSVFLRYYSLTFISQNSFMLLFKFFAIEKCFFTQFIHTFGGIYLFGQSMRRILVKSPKARVIGDQRVRFERGEDQRTACLDKKVCNKLP